MKNIRNIWDETVYKYADLPAVRWAQKKGIFEKTYGELDENVRKIRSGLMEEGFKGAHIALIGTSSAEWIESYLGIVTGINLAIPLDAGLPETELIDLLNRSDSEAVFISEKLVGLSPEIFSKCPKIRRAWLLSESESSEDYLLENTEFAALLDKAYGKTSPLEDTQGRSFKTLADLISLGEGKADVNGAGSYDIATIIYTSGTTGKSKGVMLTQENLAENVEAVEYEAAPGCVVLSVLPIHHAYCLVMDWLKTFSLGAVVCINDSFMHMVKNMGVFKPEVMLMVPLMIETIYKKLAVAEQMALHESAVGETASKSALSKELLAMVRKSIAEKVFGGRLRIIFTGGAHLDPYYIEKFEEYGVSVLEGYGMSECSPVISSNTPANHKPGSIGRPLKNVEIAFENGEILVRGTSVMKGYYRMPAETADTLKDGWLHTGDKGYLDEDGYLFINGRVKNLIIMSNGENVSPEEIENKLALNPLISEVIVTGENNGLTAMIYPEDDEVKARKLDDDSLNAQLQSFIDEFNAGQPSYRHITGLIVRQTPFARNSTGKIKRQEAAYR